MLRMKVWRCLREGDESLLKLEVEPGDENGGEWGPYREIIGG